MKNTEQAKPSPGLTVSQWLSEIEKEFPAGRPESKYTADHRKLIVELKALGYGSRRIAGIFRQKFGFGSRDMVDRIFAEESNASS